MQASRSALSCVAPATAVPTRPRQGALKPRISGIVDREIGTCGCPPPAVESRRSVRAQAVPDWLPGLGLFLTPGELATQQQREWHHPSRFISFDVIVMKC